jgi:succinyl-CoA synthetase alpha subunit
MKELGIGVSTSVGIGGDPINGSSFRDILELFENDPDTDAVMMIGEIGGPQEAEAARYCARSHEEAGDRLCGRPVGAQGPQDGPCRGHHLGLRRKRAGKGGHS